MHEGKITTFTLAPCMKYASHLILKYLQKMPIVHICDDPCTLVSHSLQRYPYEGELAFGKTRGCFELPSDDVPPTVGLSCPEIVPIEFQSQSNRKAMEKYDFLLHPDSNSFKRYVFGTR